MAKTETTGRDWRQSYWLLAGLLVLLFPAALIDRHWAVGGEAIWAPGAGIGFAALVLFGPTIIPLLVAVTAVAAATVGHPGTPFTVVLTDNSAEACALGLWAWSVRAAGVDLRMRTVRDVSVVAVAAGAATLASTALTMVVLAAAWKPAHSWTVAEHLFVSRAAGTVSLAPILLLVSSRGISRSAYLPYQRHKHRVLELSLLIPVFVIAARLAAGGPLDPPLYYPLLIPMVWAALRLGVAGTAVGAAVGTCALALVEYRIGLPSSQLMRLEIFVTVFSVAGLWFGAGQTEREDAQRQLETSRAALAESEERMRQLIDGSALFMVDPVGMVLTWNRGAELLHGYRAEEIVGHNVSVLAPDADEELYQAALHGRASTEAWRVRKDGSRYWANVMVTAIHDERGELRGYSEMVLDLTERRAAEEQLKQMATHDPLTGLPNRSHLQDRLDQALEDGTAMVGVLFIDLDGFKQINDQWGHDTGDQVLQTIGERLRSAVRPSDVAARVGGDEFVILCRHLSNVVEDLPLIAERVAAAVKEPIRLADRTVTVGASIGLAQAKPGQAADELISQADRAMYRVKRDRSRRRLTIVR